MPAAETTRAREYKKEDDIKQWKGFFGLIER